MALHGRAVEHYARALQFAKKRDAHPQVFDLTMNELASAHLALAAILQDTRPDMSDEGRLHQYEALFRHTADAALKQAIESRFGTIHHRLGKQLLLLLRTGRVRVESRKQSTKLASQHLERAIAHLRPFQSASPGSFLSALLDLLLLTVPLDGSTTGPRQVDAALKATATASTALRGIAGDPALDQRAVRVLLGALESHLRFLLGEAAKTAPTQNAKARQRSAAAERLYKELVAGSSTSDSGLSAFGCFLADLVDRIARLGEL